MQREKWLIVIMVVFIFLFWSLFIAGLTKTASDVHRIGLKNIVNEIWEGKK